MSEEKGDVDTGRREALEAAIPEEKFPDLYCPVCLRIFERPITLKCGHTVCHECLSALETQVINANLAAAKSDHSRNRAPRVLSCPSGCADSIPPRADWKPSVQLQSTIDALGRSVDDTIKETHKENRELKSEAQTLSTKAVAAGGKLKLKVCIIGQSAVGKSALAKRWLEGRFEEVAPTVGAAFTRKQPWDDLPVEFDVWDTAGQKRFQNLAHTYMRGAHALIWVVDVTREDMVAVDDALLKQVLSATQDEVPVLVLGNKVDLLRELSMERREIANREVGRLLELAAEQMRQGGAQNPHVEFMEVSALTGENVRRAFEKVLLEAAVRDMKGRMDKGEKPVGSVDLTKRKNVKQGGCGCG